MAKVLERTNDDERIGTSVVRSLRRILFPCFFGGLGFFTSINILPQHYQVVFRNSLSPSGYDLLAITLFMFLGFAVAEMVLQKL
jgi:hypothetical protein